MAHDSAIAPATVPVGPAAAVLICGWLLVHDRRIAWPYSWMAVAMALALVLLARPITRRGLLRRIATASLQIAAVLLIFLTSDRALNAWEERGPQFGAASTMASAVLNLAGYRTAVEDGRLLLDHPDGVVTVVSTMEKIALRPFLLLWLAWAALRLVHNNRRWLTGSLVGLATVLLVAMARYVVLLAVYFEHDNILAGQAGQAALDLFGSSWITGFFLIVAGLAGDRAVKSLKKREAVSSPSRSLWRWRTTLAAGARDGGIERLDLARVDVRSGRPGEGGPNPDRRPLLRNLGADGATSSIPSGMAIFPRIASRHSPNGWASGSPST